MGGPGGHFLTEEEKAAAPKITKALLSRVFSYLKPYWKQFILVLICIAISSVFGLLPSIFTGKIVDDGLIGRNMELLITYIIASLLVTLGGNLIGVAENYINTWIAQHIAFDMRNQMFRQRIDLAYRQSEEHCCTGHPSASGSGSGQVALRGL